MGVYKMIVKLKVISFKLFNFIRDVRFDDTLNQLESCDILLFCHDADRALTLDGKAYSPLLDSVGEEFNHFGFKSISIAHPWSVLTGQKACFSPLSFNGSYFKWLVKKNIIKLLGLNYRSFNISPFEKIIRNTSAKVIITIGCTDELCYQARKHDVYHIELMHGIGYKNIFWGWDNKEAVYLPRLILALDHITENTFKPLTKKGVNVKTIPNPFLKRFFGSDNLNIPKEWIPKKSKDNQYSREILVSLQHSYAGDHGLHLELAGILQNGLFFDEIERLVSEEVEVFWRFRLHPKHLTSSNYKYVLKFMNNFVSKYSNTDWVESSYLPFPSIAMRCHGNITMSSMSCYDAAICGLETLMLCPTIQPGAIYQDWFSDLEDEGYVIKLVTDYNKIKGWVNSVDKLPLRVSNLNDDISWFETIKIIQNQF